MSFVHRAQKAYERGDTVRALFVLVEGMKREPDDHEAMELLLDWYGVKHPRLGLESDVVGVLVLQPDGDDLLSTLVDNLQHGGHPVIAEALLDEGKLKGLEYLPPEVSEPVDSDVRDVPPVLDVMTSDETIDGLPAHQPDEPVEFVDAGAEPPETASEPEPDDVPVSTKVHVPTPAVARETAKEPERPNRKRLTIVVVLTALAMGLIGLEIWQSAQRSSALSRIDNAFETLDPMSPAPWKDAVESGEERWPDDEEFRDRRLFMDLFLSSASDGEDLDVDTERAWGIAAATLAAQRRGEWETALRGAKRLEMLFPDMALSHWVRAECEEGRGKLRQADEAALAAVTLQPAFLAGHLTRVDVAIRRGDKATLEKTLDTVSRLVPNHAYLELRELQLPTVAHFFEPPTAQADDTVVERTEAERMELTKSDHRFLSAATLFMRGMQNVEAGRWDVAAKDVEVAVALEPDFAPGQLMASVLRSRAGDTEGAARAMERFAALEGVSSHFRTLAQGAGSLSLAYAGRPDLAEPFLAQFGRQPSPENRAKLVGSFKLPPDENAGSAYEWAIVARAAVLNELGSVKEAIEVCENASDRGLAPERFRFVAHLLAEQGGATTELPGPSRGPGVAAHRIVKRFFAGKHREVIRESQLIEASPYSAIVLRFAVQANLALRRVGEALGGLDMTSVSLVDSIFLQGVRLRAYARLQRGGRYARLRDRMARAEPNGVNRTTDMAYAAFWQGDVRRADALVEQALARNAEHRQANWLKGLVLRAQGKYSDAKTYLKRSGKDYDRSPEVLLELGHTNYQLENWDEARKMFYRALLMERSNMDALSGLGKAYVHVDATLAQRDLARILEGYPATAEFSAHRGEALKWLAIVYGARKGRTESLQYLDRAETLVGKRADLLVTRAQYLEATGDIAGARKLFASALQRNSTVGDAHLGLARTALKSGDTKVARDHLRRYIELSSGGDDRDWAQAKLAELK